MTTTRTLNTATATASSLTFVAFALQRFGVGTDPRQAIFDEYMDGGYDGLLPVGDELDAMIDAMYALAEMRNR